MFGGGLIGGNILSSLQRHGTWTNEQHPCVWDSHTRQQQQLAAIGIRVDALLDIKQSNKTARRQHLAIVWSAGRAGFGSPNEDILPEISSFQQVLMFSDQLFKKHPTVIPSFHALSSAGGLFEGQTNVGPRSQPNPLRPYGAGKLEQERLLNSWAYPCAKYCYRPSSVYGFPRRNQRMGLIPTLLQNGMQRRVVSFSGRMETVRDYVTSEDIGYFIAEKIQDAEPSSGVYTLASAQPTTLYQLKSIAEHCIRHKLYSHFDLHPDNSANNSFHPSALPAGWNPTCVTTGLRDIHAKLLQSGAQIQA